MGILEQRYQGVVLTRTDNGNSNEENIPDRVHSFQADQEQSEQYPAWPSAMWRAKGRNPLLISGRWKTYNEGYVVYSEMKGAFEQFEQQRVLVSR